MKAEVVAQGCVVELKAAPGEAALVIRELSGTSGTLGMLQVRGVMPAAQSLADNARKPGMTCIGGLTSGGYRGYGQLGG